MIALLLPLWMAQAAPPPPAVPVAVSAPAARLPAYKSPAKLATELGITRGADPEERDGGVWYPAVTHRRLTTQLHSVRPLSDDRARLAWVYGYTDGREASAKETSSERARRIQAEANAGQLSAQVFELEQRERYAMIAAAGGGVAVGVFLAILATVVVVGK